MLKIGFTYFARWSLHLISLLLHFYGVVFSGQFAVVRRVIHRLSGEQFAAKFIKKRRYATSRRGVTRCNIEREIDVLRAVGGYEYTIKLFEVYETASDVILVLEL